MRGSRKKKKRERTHPYGLTKIIKRQIVRIISEGVLDFETNVFDTETIFEGREKPFELNDQTMMCVKE